MSRKPLADLPADIAALGRRIEQWRSQKTHKGEPMPAPLWKRAAELANAYSVNRICRSLGLHHTSLKKHMDNLTAEPDPSSPQFVEMTVGPAFDPSCVLEVERPDGARLTIRRPMGSGEMLEVARQFWSAES